MVDYASATLRPLICENFDDVRFYQVLIGCDGVNSVVSKFLGFSNPSFTARSAIRGIVNFENGHGFDVRIMHFFGKGVRFGVVPTNDHSLYWGLTFNPSSQGTLHILLSCFFLLHEITFYCMCLCSALN